MLQFIGSQRVRHDLAIERQKQQLSKKSRTGWSQTGSSELFQTIAIEERDQTQLIETKRIGFFKP